ncbi:MAG TPA: serine/threonine-protein kinase [Polyangia bacterium]|jgi:serine/threonine protein kinase|nr:serine/threonine-protein kinase [Polyangia bacterium]
MSDSRSNILDPVDHTVEIGSPGRLQATGLKAGAVLGSRFQIEAAIGEGGSGQVFRAWDRVLGEPVALKILRPDRATEKSWIKRLAREVKVARAIRHPNVCRVFDLGNVDEHWFVSMELASGGTLRDTFRSEKARALSDLLSDARAICAGLAAIHTVGITHRDVTPQNVLRMSDGHLVLSDFGLAVEGGDITVQGGTPSYMAPETAMGQRPDQRSDVWQLGSILHELFFGRRPEWTSGSRGLSLKEPARPGASVLHRQVSRLCRDCLAPNPATRPASAIEVSARLAAAEIGQSRSALARFVPRGIIMIGAALAAALLLVGMTLRHRPAARDLPLAGSLEMMSPADRLLLRSLADTMKAEGRLVDARALTRLAGPANPP